ncbi:hypothetical protein KCH_18810 [Kitasatospora cheerisanensis KCTC 2395]|uniref:Uncharacterized protein n=1 Tax=Kitasatospora cheerisanensis KCTC 2395 TaxID=1348663 RepID=A0A066Z1E5_9ACTN|nr:hypothetical protein KCH_18810 [Kitasatospora cheerisanensis KCTC 2395]
MGALATARGVSGGRAGGGSAGGGGGTGLPGGRVGRGGLGTGDAGGGLDGRAPAGAPGVDGPLDAARCTRPGGLRRGPGPGVRGRPGSGGPGRGGGRREEPAALLGRWRAGRAEVARVLAEVPGDVRVPWFGPPMKARSMLTARLMETWAHGQDVADALGVDRVPTDRLRHIAHLGVRTVGFAFAAHGRPAPTVPIRFELRSPGGGLWAWGEEGAADRVSGPALDFCLLVTQRRHRDDLALTAVGDTANAWLPRAQAFAGPPGEGRKPLR